MAEAPSLAAMYEDYKDDGFVVITMIGEDMSGRDPNKADLVEWAESFGIEHPVVADPDFEVTSRFVQGFSIALPSMDLIAPGGEILITDSWVSENQVRNNLP